MSTAKTPDNNTPPDILPDTLPDTTPDTPLEAALACVLDKVKIIAPIEEVDLNNAARRILRESVKSAINVPQEDTAAVDGYAFYSDDLADAKSLPVRGVITPGNPYQGESERGYAYRIFTGAPMPGGTDTVAMQELCTHNDDASVTMPDEISKGTNFRPKGENVRKDEIILKKGVRLGAAEIGLAGAAGITQLKVSSPLKVALISNGNEVAETGSSAGFKQSRIHDSNRPMLTTLLGGDSHKVIDCGIVPDDSNLLATAYGTAAKTADVILSSGGSSAGDEDHARGAIIANGGCVDFWRLAIKPGRPMAVGWIDDVPVFCLPGNPVAVFVCYKLVVLPVLDAMQGATPRQLMRLPLPAGFSHHHRSGRTEYLRAQIKHDSTGAPAIFIHGRKGAGVLSSLTGAEGLVEIPAEYGHVKEGDILPFIPLREHAL